MGLPSFREVELAALLLELESTRAQAQDLERDLTAITGLLAGPFSNQTAHIDYLPNKASGRAPSLLDDHQRIEDLIRGADAELARNRFKELGAALMKARRELAALGIDDPHQQWNDSRDEYYARLRKQVDEVEVLAASASTRIVELGLEISAAQAAVDAERGIRSAADESKRERMRAREALWTHMVQSADWLASLRPVRRTPWDGAN